MSFFNGGVALKKNWASIAVWLAASCIGALSCSLSRHEAHLGDEYFPMGNDAFYHGARILEAVRDPGSFYEFDARIHAPEGSLLTWPWGYDYSMAKLVRAVIHVGLADDPLKTLLWIPVAGVFVAIGLLVIIARQLGLSTWPTALAALCFALLPTTQWLYGFGQIDHHGAEMIFVLGSIAGGVAWLREPKLSTSVLLGTAFGLAINVHNGLFILQLPFLIAVFVRWVHDDQLPAVSIATLAATLLIVSLAVLIPSVPFRWGLFEFYTLSWFHLYVACCTSLFLVLMSRLAFSRRSLGSLCVLAFILVIPILHQVKIAGSFVSGSLGTLNLIQEMQSPLRRAFNGEAQAVTLTYSLLIWLAPISLVVSVIQAWRQRRTPQLLFWIACVLGLILLAMQMRMHYFGSYALYMPLLVLAQGFVRRRPDLFKRTFLLTSLALVLAYGLQLRHVLVAPMPRGGDQTLYQVFPIFTALRQACDKKPGIVLADADAGHYVRFFTKCSVIANNFLLTEQHFAKIDEMLRLIGSIPEELRKQAPYVRYVLIRPAKVTPQRDGSIDYSFFVPGIPALANSLLLGDRSDVPADFRLIYYVNFQIREGVGMKVIPYARLYEIDADEVPKSASAVSN
jgi:hypothetical protein